MTEQKKAYEKLEHLKVGALFMEMGTGKTKVALDLIASKIHKVDYVLWVCPCSVKSEIEKERKKWHKEISMDIVGCETLSESEFTYTDIWFKVAKAKSTFMVVDESLKIKNPDALRTRRILVLGSHSEYKLILNGTPLSKNILDLWTQMEFLSPKILNMSYNEFKNTYSEYYIRGRLKGMVKRQCNVEHLVSKIEPYIFDANLDLDKNKTYYDYYYTVDNYLNYTRLKCRTLAKCWDTGKIDFMMLCTTLQKYYCQSKKKDTLLQGTIDEIDGQVIVFVKFLSSIKSANAITGDTSENERVKIINRFKNGEFKALYITYGCGAFGLNLQFCHNIIFADHTFDYAQRLQAEARIYRIGQTENVNYYNLWCECGLEKLIQGCLNKKGNLLNQVKKEISKIGIEEWLKSI